MISLSFVYSILPTSPFTISINSFNLILTNNNQPFNPLNLISNNTLRNLLNNKMMNNIWIQKSKSNLLIKSNNLSTNSNNLSTNSNNLSIKSNNLLIKSTPLNHTLTFNLKSQKNKLTFKVKQYLKISKIKVHFLSKRLKKRAKNKNKNPKKLNRLKFKQTKKQKS